VLRVASEDKSFLGETTKDLRLRHDGAAQRYSSLKITF
jgi:hypothetical protein